jgi:8-oxo-dGTP pyrophosphatase MutT (NUDIX family)
MHKGMSYLKIIESIQESISNGLPGDIAHQRLAPGHRVSAAEYLKTIKEYKTACVMAVLFPDHQQELRVVLIERTGDGGVHSNQISFPGGKKEESDTSFEFAALREMEEEVGIKSNTVKVLGALTPLYIPPSNFLVYPFVGYVDYHPEFLISEREVQRVITPSIHLFGNNQLIKEDVFESARGYSVKAPYFELEDVKIWGATAMILSEVGLLLK